ncbi:MAG TPA: cellulase family glycosylhydrolase [Steroidobacteraceae bacterium]|nr:cellulase family glycosylhydrolase [Steroidobacteraceae bacterium]
MTCNESGRKTIARFALCVVLAMVTTSALADVAALSVNGNQVLAGGKPASFAGNSLFWSNTGWGGEKFYNASVVSWLKRDWKADIVRAAMGVEAPGGYLQDPKGNLARVKAVVDAAITNDMYVIIDWHSHHAESQRSEAITFFQQMAHAYGTHKHVIYEIYNEPLKISWSGKVKPYAEAVIHAIRAIDPDNLIVVGTPTWSQDVDVAAADRIAGANIAYALHFYAGSHGKSLRDKAQQALDRGVALFVTEWGAVNSNGDGSPDFKETSAWMNFLETRGISHANWATNDKAEGASALVRGASTEGGWPANQLTASGSLARKIISAWGSAPLPDDELVLNVPGYADFIAVDGESVWVTNEGRVERWSAKGKIASVTMPKPCGAMSVAFGSLWVADCTDLAVYRIDIRTAKTLAVIRTGIADPEGETNVVAGDNSIWVPSAASGKISRIDPSTNLVTALVTVDAGTSYLAYGFDSLWAVSSQGATLQQIDLANNQVARRVALGRQPGFLAAGEGGVWVQEQGDGTVARVDPGTAAVTGRVKVGDNLKYGDIDTGDGKVWLRTTADQTFVVIDPKSMSVLTRIGKPSGSGGLRYTPLGVWTSAHDLHTLSLWKTADQAKSR